MLRTGAISGTIFLYQMICYVWFHETYVQSVRSRTLYILTWLQLHQRLIQVSCTPVEVKDALLLTNRTGKVKVLTKLLLLTFKVSQEGVIFHLKPSFGVGTGSVPKRVLICCH